MKKNTRYLCCYLCGVVKLVCVISLVTLTNTYSISANAAILSGNVSFDSNTSLYTYSYILNNTSGPAVIKELSILFDSSQNIASPPPLSFTTPAGWHFSQAVSGSSADAPLNEFGAFWQWHASQALSVGSTMSGYSFTTSFAPVTGSANNYFLWSNSYSGGPSLIGNGGIVEWGHIVAPDFSAATVVPIPAAVWLFGSGLLGLLGVARQRHKPGASII